MAAQPERHVAFQGRRQAGRVEDIDPALLVHEGPLAAGADARLEPAVVGQRRLDEGHPEGAAFRADRLLESLRVESVEHELDGTGGAAPQSGDHRSELVSQDRDDDQVVGCRLVEGAGDVDLGPSALDVDDGAVAFELL